MNLQDMVPPEVKEFSQRNLKYLQDILEPGSAKKGSLEKIRRELALAPTPKKLIYQECSVKVYRFTPVQKKLSPVPVLLVPSLILRYWVMDLMTGHSLIENLVQNGIDTYLVDWGTPGEEHGRLTFDYYVETFLRRAVRQVRRATGCPKINLLGQCLGGTIGAMYAALHPDEISRFCALTAPFDFTDAGLLSLWTKKENFDVEKVVGAFGSIVPADFIHACFQFLDLKATVERYKKLYNNILDENFMRYYKALDTWLNDKIPFPGQVFVRFIKGLYQENLLAKGKFEIDGRFVDLKNISCPVLNIVAQYDHVFPESAARKLNELVSGRVQYHVVPAGHVTLVVLFPEREKTYALVREFFEGES